MRGIDKSRRLRAAVSCYMLACYWELWTCSSLSPASPCMLGHSVVPPELPLGVSPHVRGAKMPSASRCRVQGCGCGGSCSVRSGPVPSPVFPREADPWHICLETGTLPPRCPLHFCRLWPVSAVISTRRGWCREDHAGPRALCHLVTCRWECGGWAYLCAGAASGGWGEGQGRSGARAGCTRAWRVSPGQRSLCRVCVPGPGPGAVLQVGWSHLVYATLLDLTSGCSGLSGMNAFSAV